MSGKNVSQLKLPGKKRLKKLARLLPNFETAEAAKEEDGKRAQLLRTRCKSKQARKLADKLDHPWKVPDSWASSQASRRARLRLVSALQRLVKQEFKQAATEKGTTGPGGQHAVCLVTIIPDHLELNPDQLRQCEVKRLMRRLRYDLYRVGAQFASGWFIAAVDVSVCLTGNKAQLHFHGIASGEMIDVVGRLRLLPKYASATANKKVVQCKPIDQKEYGPALSYVFKSFGSLRMMAKDERTNTLVSRKVGRRIPEPWHSEILLWQDAQNLKDAVLLMKLRARRTGFGVMK